MSWSNEEREQKLMVALQSMNEIFVRNPEAAVRSQEFIQTFHRFIADDIASFLTPKAKRAGVKVLEEAQIFGSYKSKNVDVAVVHPVNGPLVIIGVRSQMSSVGKNALTYYQDIVGEAISLQERFPMSVAGYAYLHPYEVRPWQRRSGTWTIAENPNHQRYARMYAAIGQRDDRLYKQMTGAYDQFAYSVVDFHSAPIALLDDVVAKVVKDVDLSILTFVPRLIETFHLRNLWMEDIFEATRTDEFPEGDTAENLDDTLVEQEGAGGQAD